MNRHLTRPCPVGVIDHGFSRSIENDAHFLQFAQSIASQPYTAVLLSGGPVQPEGENRYSIIAWNPYLVFESKATSVTVKSRRKAHTFTADPLEVLDEIISRFQPDFPLLIPPFSGGAVGYFSYDLKNAIEKLPQTAHDDLQLPDIMLFWPRRVLVFDRLSKQSKQFELVYQNDDNNDAAEFSSHSVHPETPILNVAQGFSPAELGSPEGLCYVENANQEPWVSGWTPVDEKTPDPDAFVLGPLESNFSHSEYLRAVRRVRQYIRAGDVYQVNLSQRYRFGFQGDAFRLWRALYELNPAPFYSFIQAGRHQVLSTSMERFLCRRGRYIETRPIKGTRKRGKTEQEDDDLKRDLASSPKDDAELSMIVDLLRNDLGQVCLPRTIRVAEHKRLESYQNVHHLVSIVIGHLRDDVTYGDLIRATFPGGSITGCPKIRSMEIIDELESNVRHIYTGSIGYLGWHRNMDLNIAIRTALVHDKTCYFSVGGGIVFDSNEEDEYQETLHKGRTLFQVIERIGERTP